MEELLGKTGPFIRRGERVCTRARTGPRSRGSSSPEKQTTEEKCAFLFSRCRNAPDARLQGCRVSTNISTKAVSIQATVEQNDVLYGLQAALLRHSTL